MDPDNTQPQEPGSPSAVGIIIVALCGIALAGIVAFGNPSLWMTNDQAFVLNSAVGLSESNVNQ